MKRAFGLLLFTCLLLSGFPARSETFLSCDDLANVADDLAYISDAVYAGIPIEEDDDIDIALADVIDALYYIAEYEENDILYDVAISLDDAWEEMDREAFVDALDVAVDEFDSLYVFECSE
ncbi:hypothetical protein FLX56_25200 [Synechococcus moorigangaii CMS01]|nr:hypothetical protein [Synechococcus moorigangaii CMS01]